MLLVIATLFMVALLSSQPDPLLGEPAKQTFADAMRLSSQGRHDEAERLARTWTGSLSPEGRVLQAVTGLSRFADLHDPASLERARAALDLAVEKLDGKTTARERFMLAMALSQQSFLASTEGRDLSAALTGRKAALLCQELMEQGLESPDLRGILGGYFFWKAQSLGALRFAFGGDTRAKGLEWTRQAAASESPFREAYRISLMWIRFERKEFAMGLALAREGIAAYPGNRLYRQAEGDMLFRLGRRQEALDTYRASWMEYAGVEVVPANRLAAAGNLARIHHSLGRGDSARAWLDTLDAGRYVHVRKWLPPSLVRELVPIRKELAKR